MLKDSQAFSGFSVDDLQEAKAFYGKTLGLDVAEQAQGLRLKISGSRDVFLYVKQDHRPATYTVLNFPVENLERTVDALRERGVQFERYPNFEADERGIVRGKGRGPDIAWFKDPAGNVLSVLRE